MRRTTLLTIFMVVMLMLAACSGGGAAPAQEAAPAAQEAAPAAQEAAPAEPATPSQYSEAPMLAELVAAGDLPAVDERLPKDLQVIEPVEQIGKYGGTWRAVTGNAQMNNIKMKIYEPPIRWKADYSGYEPGLAKAYEWSEDGTEFTLHFREGVRWSDGEPFTMADMEFWWEDLAKNSDYKVVNVPWWGFKSTGEPMDVEFPDDYTMIMKWDRPQWVTPYIMAQGFWEWEPMMKPKHYLSQFHPTYNSSSDYDTLEQKDKWWENPDFPTIFAWDVESVTIGERWVLVRNPYYWKVDTAGNQLPYIDRIDVEYVEDPEVRLLNIAQGKYDASFRGSGDPTHIPILLDQAQNGGYHLLEGFVIGSGGWPTWLINQDYIGPGRDAEMDNEIRMMLRDVNFRKGISHALNRQRVIDVAWEGIGNPQNMTISPQSWHFQSEEGQRIFKEWQEADISYDPALANDLLDKAGLTGRDSEGFRTLPSGKRLEIIIDVGDWGTERISLESSEVLKDNLADVGLRALINNLTGQPDWDLRQREGKYMLRTGGTSELDIWTYPDWVFPVRDNRAWPMQGKWRQTGGAEGEEPLPGSPAARLQALYDKGLAEPDEQKRHEIVWEAVRIHIEEGPFSMAASGDQASPSVVKNNFHNVPELGVMGPWAPGSPGNLHPEQFYMD
jgi:peptide/nickel transport system substrate-binding protein